MLFQELDEPGLTTSTPSHSPHERDARAHIFCFYLVAAVLAHLASVFRNGNAFGGGSMVPVSDVLKGTMRL